MSTMPETLLRAGVLILIGLLTWLVVWSGRLFVQRQRNSVLSAPLEAALQAENSTGIPSNNVSPVRILAFSSADCRQCHLLQTPALQQVKDTYGDQVSIVEVDAPNEPELAQRYRVLTVPTTVVLDTVGRAHAVNYGFANSVKLRGQVGKVLG
jgi:thioredoxin-like negative regulator of GroEL